MIKFSFKVDIQGTYLFLEVLSSMILPTWQQLSTQRISLITYTYRRNQKINY